jgi:GNAT superfamily N-acetyltransferase
LSAFMRESGEGIHPVSLRASPKILLEEMLMTVTDPGRHNKERWRFWRDVLVFNLKVLLGNLRDFALIPVSLVAALVDIVSKGEQEGSLFYRVLRWGAHSEEVLDAYSAVKRENLSVNPNHTVDAVIARIENVLVREYEKGGTARSIKAALDRAIDQVQHGTGGHRGRMEGAITKVSETLAKVGLQDRLGSPSTQVLADGDAIKIRPMACNDAMAVTELAAELGYPNEVQDIERRINVISNSDLLLVAVDSEDKIIGFIQGHRVWIMEVGFRVEILGLVVSQTARRRGVARKLIAEIERWAENDGAEIISVRTNTKRTESHLFYRALGFTAIKTQSVYEKRPEILNAPPRRAHESRDTPASCDT